MKISCSTLRRALGDEQFKPLVSNDCDITTVKLGELDDFLIVACDGLWDGLTPAEAVQVQSYHCTPVIIDLKNIIDYEGLHIYWRMLRFKGGIKMSSKRGNSFKVENIKEKENKQKDIVIDLHYI